MTFIVDSFEFIINTIKTVWDFFTGILENTLLMLDFISHSMSILTTLVDSMPVWAKSFAFITLFISALYLILNRESG